MDDCEVPVDVLIAANEAYMKAEEDPAAEYPKGSAANRLAALRLAIHAALLKEAELGLIKVVPAPHE